MGSQVGVFTRALAQGFTPRAEFEAIVIDIRLALAFLRFTIGCTNNYCCKSSAEVAARVCVVTVAGGWGIDLSEAVKLSHW